jgi:lysophospholipase L1-like esterase
MELNGKTVLFLGSSVTYGSAAGGVSFVDILRERCGVNCIKEAVSGTTLADINEKSYVSRLKAIDRTVKLDLFVCQLSTNDATKKIDIKEIETAICFILDYVKAYFNCPIAFYTGTYFECEEYAKMIELLYELKKKYEFYILDLYHNEDMLGVSKEDHARYMKDKIHPTLPGYREWWTPKFISFLEQL